MTLNSPGGSTLQSVLVRFDVPGTTSLVISMADSTKVLCPLFDKIEILKPSDSLSIFPYLNNMEF